MFAVRAITMAPAMISATWRARVLRRSPTATGTRKSPIVIPRSAAGSRLRRSVARVIGGRSPVTRPTAAVAGSLPAAAARPMGRAGRRAGRAPGPGRCGFESPHRQICLVRMEGRVAGALVSSTLRAHARLAPRDMTEMPQENARCPAGAPACRGVVSGTQNRRSAAGYACHACRGRASCRACRPGMSGRAQRERPGAEGAAVTGRGAGARGRGTRLGHAVGSRRAAMTGRGTRSGANGAAVTGRGAGPRGRERRGLQSRTRAPTISTRAARRAG